MNTIDCRDIWKAVSAASHEADAMLRLLERATKALANTSDDAVMATVGVADAKFPELAQCSAESMRRAIIGLSVFTSALVTRCREIEAKRLMYSEKLYESN